MTPLSQLLPVTTTVFIGICCVLVEHVHSIRLTELLGKTRSELGAVVKETHQNVLEEAIRIHAEWTKVEHFSTAERVFRELEAKIAEGGELEKGKKNIKDQFNNAKEALKSNPNDAEAEADLAEAARKLASIDGTYKAALQLLQNASSKTWKQKTLAEIQAAKYVAQQEADSAWIVYMAAVTPSLREKLHREFDRAEQKLAAVQKVCEAKDWLDKYTYEVEVLKEQKAVSEKADAEELKMKITMVETDVGDAKNDLETELENLMSVIQKEGKTT